MCNIATAPLTSALYLQRGYEGDWLGNTFSIAVFLGNGLVAILAGLLGHGLVETFNLGPVAPFDAAAGEHVSPVFELQTSPERVFRCMPGQGQLLPPSVGPCAASEQSAVCLCSGAVDWRRRRHQQLERELR